jgi:hypothetical protein
MSKLHRFLTSISVMRGLTSCFCVQHLNAQLVGFFFFLKKTLFEAVSTLLYTDCRVAYNFDQL